MTGSDDEKASGRAAAFPCPCCGYLVFAEGPGSHEICPICFWEDDLVQLRYAALGGGANGPSLIQAQASYADCGACEPRCLPWVRRPATGERREPGWRPLDPTVDRVETPAPGAASTPHPPDLTALYYWRPTYWPR